MNFTEELGKLADDLDYGLILMRDKSPGYWNYLQAIAARMRKIHHMQCTDIWRGMEQHYDASYRGDSQKEKEEK